MKTQYSIIYIQPNSLTAEKVAIGLIAFTTKKIWFDYEPTKIDVVEKLYPSLNVKTHLHQSFKGMKAFIHHLNKEASIPNTGMFTHKNVFAEDTYADYLYNYSPGLIHFSEPLPFANPIDGKSFEMLLDKFIGNKTVSKEQVKNTFHSDFKKKIHSAALGKKVDIDYKISPSKIEGIYSDTQVRVIGKNGVITAIQDIDFTILPEALGHQLNQWEVLVNALNTLSKAKNWAVGDYNVVFNKPAKNSFQEKLLNKIHDQKKGIFNLLEIDEADKLLNKILENDYKPLSKLI